MLHGWAQNNTGQQKPAARLTAADFAIDTDQAIGWLIPVPTLYVLRRAIARRVTGAYNTACLGGIYTAASKGGTALVAATQTWIGLSGAGKIAVATLEAVVATDVQTAPQLYFSLSTANGAALTADILLFVDVIA